MGIASIPAASAGGGISSVQRGSAGASGNVTITAVDIAKSFVTIFGSASSGTVAATGAISASINAANGTNSAVNFNIGDGAHLGNIGNQYVLLTRPINAGTFAGNSTNFATNITGGTNNLVAAQVTGFLANSTTLTVSGACRYEVVEFA